MPIGDAYVTTSVYRASIKKTSAADDAQELLDLKAIARYMDRRLGRFFNQTASEARVYVPGRNATITRDRRTLYVDDVALSSGVTIKVDTDLDGLFSDETAFASTDYELHDLNAALQPEAEPWTRIFIPSWSTKDLWKSGYPVQVTATFGWPAVPGAIARANAYLCAILRLETPRATERVPEAIDAAMDASPKAKAILGELMARYARPQGPRASMVFA